MRFWSKKNQVEEKLEASAQGLWWCKGGCTQVHLTHPVRQATLGQIKPFFL